MLQPLTSDYCTGMVGGLEVDAECLAFTEKLNRQDIDRLVAT